MNIWKRAIIFLTRKKRRSLLLLFTLLVFGIVMTMSVSIYRISEKESNRLQEELGGSFVLTQNRIEDSALWDLEQSESGSVRIYKGPEVDSDLISRIAEVDGIKAYNEEDSLSMHLPDAYIVPGLYQGMLDLAEKDPRFELTGDKEFWRNVTNFISNDYSELNTYFRTNSLELTKGRHIEKGDRQKIVVSETFAQNNNLNLGDTIDVEMTQLIANPLENVNDVIYKFQPEIVGIFRENLKQAVNEYTPESLVTENFIFIDTDTMQTVNKTFTSDMGATKKSIYFVQDPSELDDIIKSVEDLKDINWTYYNLEKDDSMYRSSVKPLENLNIVMLIMAGGIWLASILVVGLLLTMWTNERKREMGILVSIGIPKRKILLQLMLESILVAVTAFIISFVISGYLSEPMANKTLQVMTPETEAPEVLSEDEILKQVRSGEFNAEPAVSMPSNTPEHLEVKIGIVEIFFVLFSGVSVIMLAVWISSRKILKQKPKEILSSR